MLRQIHFPDSWEALEQARKHLVLTEFFSLQLLLGAKRVQQAAVPGARAFQRRRARAPAARGAPLRAHRRASPRRSPRSERDLASPRPMYRLLHGDVGAGKTLVALSAMLLAVEAG